MNLKKLKKPENKNVLGEKPKRGRKSGRYLTASLRVGLTEEEMEKIRELSEERGSSYSHIVRSLLKEAGHI